MPSFILNRAMRSLRMKISAGFGAWSRRLPALQHWSGPVLVVRRALGVPLILACAMLWQGCGDLRQHIQRQLRDGGAEQLRHDATLLYNMIRYRNGQSDFVEVEFKDWPQSIQKLSPRHVGVYLDGVSIALSRGDRNESGLFIVPESRKREPETVRGTSYQKVAEGVFWYSFETNER